MNKSLIGTVALTLSLLIGTGTVHAQQQTGRVLVEVQYWDGDEWQYPGEYTSVWLWSEQDYYKRGSTNIWSRVWFEDVPYGEIELNAQIDVPTPYKKWVCIRDAVVDKPQKAFIIYCVTKTHTYLARIEN